MCKSLIKSFWLMLCILGFIYNTQGQSISGSAHDFSSQSWSTEICLPCHTPHNADTTVADAPLWNHDLTTATFTLYSSPTMNVPVNQPSGVSKLCLSCHDGTVALDSFGGNAGSTFIGSDYDLTTDLSDDHPISIDWIHQTELPTSEVCLQCHFIGGNSTFSILPFFDGKVECASCHDVHNTNTAVDTPLLRLPLTGSEICLHCHGK